MSSERSPRDEEVLMTDLKIGDQFSFDGSVYTVAEPPQSVWGVVELWVEELNWPLQGSETSTVEPIIA
ncbi:hypothetical protein [Janibacter cremeus]|uniref:Uncharacterized protein n=1 Tax=Janibacter cremeus TaxID=1285192 RepID=A0A852VLU4_9MICO|nr:hypothetical protein [Janibacter cremeus]NYF97066.1 hypothetical protein [Janibacter cremeus]